MFSGVSMISYLTERAGISRRFCKPVGKVLLLLLVLFLLFRVASDSVRPGFTR
jgi:hypothetical protein